MTRRTILNTASVVRTDRLPVPPFSALGLWEFAGFENQPLSGITYKDTYFLQRSVATDETLHLHELVHVVQWQVLGPKDFLLLYAVGLAGEDSMPGNKLWSLKNGDTKGGRVTNADVSLAADVGVEPMI